ncbi:hypothetical protein [Streptomyces hirsutus]|uniref:hypothetical protein n=1 Tax=Streptomyces hirsutus TaxID=35620 RepID=UPI003674E949
MKILRGCAIAAAVPVLLLGGLFVLAACTGPSGELSAQEVAGVWKGSGGGRVEFADDGTFTMSGMPRSAIEFSFIDPPPGKGSLFGRGSGTSTATRSAGRRVNRSGFDIDQKLNGFSSRT